MIEALRDFLQHQDCGSVYCDFMPDEHTEAEAIGVFCWTHSVAEVSDGTGTFFVQLQVRRSTYEAAKKTCAQLFALLDSGLEETQIWLSEKQWCIARPRRGPVLLNRTAKTTTFYCEIALWGENQEV